MTWGGWFGQKLADVGINLKQVIVPVIAVVATIATGGAAAGIIGTTVLETVGVSTAAAEASIIGSATVANVTGGAVLGAGTGALNAAINNQNIAKGALTGGVTGGVGQLAGGLAGSLLSAPSGDIVGPNQPNVLGSTVAGAGVIGGAKGLAGGTAGALAGGAPLTQALKSGAISGASGALTAGLSQGLGLDKTTSSILGSGISYGLGKAFQPTGGSSVQSRAPQYAQTSQPSEQYLAPSQTTTLGTSLTQAPSGQAVGTPSALGSALFAAPGFS